MISIERVILDVLKPHRPNLLQFADALAKVGKDYQVGLKLLEMNNETETIQVEVKGSAIDFDIIEAAIETMGGTVRSIDEVDVKNSIGPD
jgi:hypothetical protein